MAVLKEPENGKDLARDDCLRALVFGGARYSRECLCWVLNSCQKIDARSVEAEIPTDFAPDVILVDGRLERAPVTTFIRNVRIRAASAPIIYLESGEPETELVKVLEAGAVAYVTRSIG